MNAKSCRPWVVAMLLAGLAGCSGGPRVGGGGGDGPGEGGGDPNKAADVSLTAKQFAQEHKENKDAAARKYKGKVIELSGVVNNLGASDDGNAYLSLEGVEGDLFGDVKCATADKQPWKKATPGQTVKVKGRWMDFSLLIGLSDAVITDVSGTGAPTLTAELLAKEYAADQDAANKKYDNKHLILTGEVERVDFNEVDAAEVILKAGVARPKVFCNFAAFDRDATKKLKAGQRVMILGQYILNFGEEEVGLQLCTLLE